MPRKITQADINHVWHVYKSMHGTQPLTKEEVGRGVQVLLRTGGLPANKNTIHLKFVTGRNQTRFIDVNHFNVNLTDGTNWQDIVHHLTWRCDGGSKAMELKLVRRACEGNFLVGALKPVPKPVVKLTKEEVRAGKIKRLQERQAVWLKKMQRCRTAISKISRSLNAYRRHEK